MSTAEETVDRYLTLANEHDVPAALGCLADSFELRFVGSEFAIGKDAIADALAWDAGTDGQNEWRVVGTDGPRVTVEGQETNEFLSLLGIEALRFRSTFEVDDDGRIASQTHRVEWGDVTLEDAMEPLVAWASRHEPEELDAIYPEGRMVYTEEMGLRWVALARRWREDEP